MNKDLTTGKPEKVLWQFCLPLFGSIIFQQLYNIADSFVAGKFISDNALAAVGNSYEITLIFIAFAFGCNIACSVLAALFFGAKQYNDLKTTVYTALISSCVICAVLMLVGTLCCDSLLRLIKTPEEVFADSKLYLDIYIYGLPFVFLYNVATGIFSALGDSKTPFIFLACSSTSNIAVDILFVTAFNMGVAGVAWATFLCQGISCVLALVVVFRRFAKIPTEGKVKIFSWNHFGRFAVIAIPSILQQSFISVGNIIIQSVINSFGAAVMAGYSATAFPTIRRRTSGPANMIASSPAFGLVSNSSGRCACRWWHFMCSPGSRSCISSSTVPRGRQWIQAWNFCASSRRSTSLCLPSSSPTACCAARGL